MEYFGYLASVIIGLSLGLIGGGGSILTIPILVYLFGTDPKLATTYSLFIVGITALSGCFTHYRIGNLKIKSAMYFAVPSIFSILVIREVILLKIPVILFDINGFQVTKNFLIMIIFAVLMIAASFSMICKTNAYRPAATTHYFQLAFIGAMVGIVTGFLGAGGGFLIIPALLFFANLPMKQAVGTSLLIIFLNSSIGFMGDLYIGTGIDYPFLFTISIMAFIGMIIGTQLSKKINSNKLKPVFGWFILVMGVYILFKEIAGEIMR